MNDINVPPKEIESIPLEQDKVFFRIDCNFETDKATFFFSLDGNRWEKIGDSLQMLYSLPKHFMGYRFGLFNYATAEIEGHVDFDYYRIGEKF
ncbi:hypothetical protein [Flagellimonas sp. GZD32]|uniref:beta-xylosidase family glycoside hydrolase n=1 Tax=Flagellimonas cixiensis TaxID=3228750 RepID=UPI0035C92C15